jgi:hypothetical protein
MLDVPMPMLDTATPFLNELHIETTGAGSMTLLQEGNELSATYEKIGLAAPERSPRPAEPIHVETHRGYEPQLLGTLYLGVSPAAPEPMT